MDYARHMLVWLITWLVSWSLAQGQKPNLDAYLNRRQDVYIAGFFPFGKGVEHAGTGRGVMPSVKLALDHVNEHDSILRNYRLHMWWNDTECNAAVGVKSFFDMMHSGPNKLMLFGAACTHVTDPIAKASKRWLLTQLSYADTHPMFTKESFPNFFRVVPSENAFNLPRLALLAHFNWTRVGTIYQNEPRYALAHNRLVADLDEHGFEVVETQSFAGDARAALERLKEKDVRIILGNFNETWAIHVFCEAYRLEMYGRAYQWLIQGAYSDRWWRRRTVCPRQHLARALDTVILTDLLPLSTTGDITISGITAKEYQVEYDRRRGSEYSRFHGYTYDGIWAVALAIQTVAARARQLGRREVLDFRYRDRFWEELFLTALHNVSFEGVTGPVRFYDNERKASILLKQFQGEVSGEVKVGEYCAELARLDFSTGTGFRWTGRYPPKDRTLHRIEHTQVNITIYAVLASCSVLGILLATGFLAMNIRYRNQRYIKMSSPHLNNVIIIGCILTYTSVIFLGLDSGLSSIAAFPYICTARAWLLMAGFSLAFGAMFSKTWRVHSIFTDLKLNKKVIKDYQLFMVVGVLISVDMIIMVTWQVADPFYRATKQMEPYPDPSSEDILIIRENEYCQSERMNIFIGIIYAYKGLLLVFGAFLAWETRHVSIPALNDSKHVGLSVYNVLIMCIMGAAIALVLTDHKDALFVLISIFIIFCTTGTLCLVFVPKLLELRRNGQPGSADKRIRATLRPASKGHDCRSPGPELERRLKELRTTNSKFRRTLQAKENELQLLLGKLGSDGGGVVGGVALVGGKTTSVRLAVPIKEQPSLPETSDITSLCSLSQSQGAEADYCNIQDKTKPTSTAPPASDVTADRKERERSAAKNVSFKNHVDAPPKPTTGGGVKDQQVHPADTPPPPYKNHADSNGAAPRAVPEKDQLAKFPYGWSMEEPPNKYQPLKPSSTANPEYPPAAQRLSEAKPSAPQLEHQAYQQQQPIQQPLQQSQHITQPIYQQMQPIHQQMHPIHQQVQPTHQQVQQPRARHRRTSSIGQAALISDLMTSSAETDELVTKAPLTERKVIGAERDDSKPTVTISNSSSAAAPSLKKQAAIEPDIEPIIPTDRERRKSICRRDSQKRKSNFIVVQSDLWDTNTFSYTSPKPATPTATRDHAPMQRSVSEKNPRHQVGSGASGQRDNEPRAQSIDRRSSNGSLYGGTQPSGTPGAAVAGSGWSEGRGSRGTTPDGYRDADTLRMQDRAHKRRGSELPAPAQTTTPTRQQRRRQSSAQIRDPDSSPPSSPSALSVARQSQPTAIPAAVSTAPVVPPPTATSAFTAATATTASSNSSVPRRQAHHRSTPDVMGMMRKQKKATSSPDRKRCDPCLGHEQIVQHSRPDESIKKKSQDKSRDKSRDKHETGKLYAASSESELFECAILPIFQKLLTERHKSQPHGLNLSYGVSCPNISIKCDIVEYL